MIKGAAASVPRSRWSIAAPFFVGENDRWIDDFVADDGLTFRKIAAAPSDDPDWHSRSVRGTPLQNWTGIWRHARRACVGAPDGIVTLFPQLATMAGLQNIGRRRKVVAWCFNVGARPPPAQLALARWAFRHVDRFVVHSMGEVAVLGEWFDIEPERIRFVHLQQAELEVVQPEEDRQPFIVAMGSANRDFETFLKAVEGTGIPTRLLTSPRLLKKLHVPDNVTVLSPIPANESRALAKAARISVVPLKDTPVASGQVTVVEAMRMGRPVIATRTVGTRDYIEHRTTGMLTEPGDIDDLRGAILEVWDDYTLRTSLGAAGRAYAEATFSDEAAARNLATILKELTP